MSHLSEVVENVEDTFASVSEILGMIKDISEQITLLTLNASIEAARAGQAGRGFAVVAGQMRQLVEQTSEATGRTEEILKDGRKVVQVIQEMMAGYQNMANSIQQQSNNLNCQIENLAGRMEQFQVKAR